MYTTAYLDGNYQSSDGEFEAAKRLALAGGDDNEDGDQIVEVNKQKTPKTPLPKAKKSHSVQGRSDGNPGLQDHNRSDIDANSPKKFGAKTAISGHLETEEDSSTASVDVDVFNSLPEDIRAEVAAQIKMLGGKNERKETLVISEAKTIDKKKEVRVKNRKKCPGKK